MIDKISKAGLYLPHIYFAIICIIIVIATSPNIAMIGIATLLLVVMLLKNKIINVTVSAFLLFFSFWVFLAYLSSCHEIEVMDSKAWQSIIMGGLFIIVNFTMSIMMGFPFFKEQADLSGE